MHRRTNFRYPLSVTTTQRSTVITGGAGFIGQHLTRHLAGKGLTVSVVDSQSTGAWDTSINALFVPADLRHLSEIDLDQLLPDNGTLFHLAAAKYKTPGVSLSDLVENNVAATARLFQCAARKRMRIVFASSLYAHGGFGPLPMSEHDRPAPTTVYGATKLFGENLLTSLSSPARPTDEVLPFVHSSVRLMFVYGPNQYPGKGYKSVIRTHFERIHNMESPIVIGDGEQVMDYIYVHDVVHLLARLAEMPYPPRLINIGSGEGTSILELTQKVQDVTGSPKHFVTFPADHTHGTSRVADISLLKRTFPDFRPTPLDEGLAATWQSFAQEIQ